MNATECLEQLNTAIAVCDLEFRVVSLNPAAQQLFAVSEGKAKGAVLSQLVRFPEKVLDVMHTDHANIIDRQCSLVDALGVTRTVDLTMTLISIGSEPQILLECIDLERHLRIAKESQILAQQELSKQVLRGFAHEMKNPLGGLRGAAQLLERELGADSELLEYTRVIVDEADRLRNLLDRMLVPGSRLELTEVNVHAILERVAALVKAEDIGPLTLKRDYDPSIPELQADFDRLLQAMLNLVRNAALVITESSVGGIITLRSRIVRNFTIGKQQHRLVVCLTVQDDGPGVPEDIRDRLFFPLVTGRNQGTGLGLSISQNLIAQHGGLIECHSEPGNTEFAVYLPLENDHG